MIEGDYGPVENELLLSIVLVVIGYLTPAFFQSTMGETFLFLDGLPLIGSMKWGVCLIAILLPM